jgi:hypothetical protein
LKHVIFWMTNDRRRGIGLVLLIAGLAVMGLKAWQIAATVRSLQSRITQAQAMVQPATPKIDPAQVGGLVMGARADVLSLRADAGPLLWLAPHLGWLPGVGGDLQAAPALLDMADGLTEAGVLMWQGMSPFVASWSASGQGRGLDMLQPALAQVAAARPQIEQARVALARAATARASIQINRLSPKLAGQLGKFDAILPLAQVGADAALAAPEVLGLNGPRTYLILAQNEDEIRPTGGFISGVGEVRVEAGRLTTLSFRDSYAADDFSQPYPDPPEPLRRYMQADLWVFRDSNWSPDFPTAARRAISLYRPGPPVSVDGVIAADQHALQGLVSALGPLTVVGEEKPITGDMVITYIRRAWAPQNGGMTREWWKQRKSFMGPLADAAWKRIQSGQVDWSTLVKTLLRLLDEKHILVYLPNPDASRLLAQQGWDGAVRPGSGDFFMVADANLGFNKVNARVQEALTYQVDLQLSPPQAILTLVYTHTSTANTPCIQDVNYSPTYEQMMDRCYWDYVQVYVPQGSRLLDATHIPISGTSFLSGKEESGEVTVRQAEEGPWLSMGVMSLLPTLAMQSRFVRWSLPENVLRWQGNEGWYNLRVQKQPGTLGHPLTVRIRLPEGSLLLDATPGAQVVEDNWVIYQMTLERDRMIQLHLRRQP